MPALVLHVLVSKPFGITLTSCAVVCRVPPALVLCPGRLRVPVGVRRGAGRAVAPGGKRGSPPGTCEVVRRDEAAEDAAGAASDAAGRVGLIDRSGVLGDEPADHAVRAAGHRAGRVGLRDDADAASR